MKECIGRLAYEVETFNENDVGKTIHRYFEENIYSEGIVILDKHTPVGLIMRNEFYQTMGKQYGYSLYMNRPINIIMTKEILVVDSSVEVAEVSMMAMNRKNESMYDFVIVTQDEKYIGVVSIKFFLIELSKKREKENEMLKEQHVILKRANELEKTHRLEMEEKNVELNLKNSSIKNLLDNAGQGFLSFNKDMKISKEYSLECKKIFVSDVSNINFIDLIKPYVPQDKIETIKSIFDSIFNNDAGLQCKVYLSLLPKELKIREKTVRFEYKPIDEDFDKKIMVILTDITDKKALEMKMAEERNNLKLIVKVISNKRELISTIEEFELFFERQGYDIIHSGQQKKDVFAEIFRIIHTFKGDFGHLGLYNTANNLHVMENTLAKMSEEIESLSLNDMQTFIREIDYASMMDKDLFTISDVLGEDYLKSKENLSVSKEKIIEIEDKIKSTFKEEESKEILTLLQNLKCTNLKDILSSYNDSIKDISTRLEKYIEDIVVEGDDVYIDKQKYSKVFKSLVHIFRNSIDHGIELPEERLEKGKPEIGTISCNLKKLKDYFILTIKDDGRGITPEKIVQKAIEKKILPLNAVYNNSSLSYEKVMDLLFTNEFSTKDCVSIFSGRGVGLCAVKAEVINLGGEITISSQPEKYTEFIITLPFIW